MRTTVAPVTWQDTTSAKYSPSDIEPAYPILEQLPKDQREKIQIEKQKLKPLLQNIITAAEGEHENNIRERQHLITIALADLTTLSGLSTAHTLLKANILQY